MATGAAWMVAFKLVERSLGLISTLILARLLVPADFGLVAMATSVIAVLELMGAFSFDVQLIQNPSAQRRHFDTAWTFNVLFAVCCGVILVFVAHPASLFYTEPRLEAVMYFLALGQGIQGLENIGVVAFRRQLEFDREFKFLIGKKLASFLVTVPLAFWLRSYWALVAGILVGKFASLILSYYIHPYRPRFSLAAARELYSVTRWLLINNVVLFLNNRSADFIIGKVAGAQALGLYSVAYEISNLPTTELVAPINRATFPGYARLAPDITALRDSFLDVVGLVSLFALPVAAGISLTADLFVPVLLGANWLPMVPVIQVLACYGALMAIQTNIGVVYLALGRPRLVTFLAAVQFAVLFPLLILFSQAQGATGAAWAFLITVCVLIPVNQFFLVPRLMMRWWGYFAQVWRPLLAVCVMTACVLLFRHAMPNATTFMSQVGLLLSTVLVGAVTYVGGVLALWFMAGRPGGAERKVLSQVSRRFTSPQSKSGS